MSGQLVINVILRRWEVTGALLIVDEGNYSLACALTQLSYSGPTINPFFETTGVSSTDIYITLIKHTEAHRHILKFKWSILFKLDVTDL